jgi:hypothetical protein
MKIIVVFQCADVQGRGILAEFMLRVGIFAQPNLSLT